MTPAPVGVAARLYWSNTLAVALPFRRAMPLCAQSVSAVGEVVTAFDRRTTHTLELLGC